MMKYCFAIMISLTFILVAEAKGVRISTKISKTSFSMRGMMMHWYEADLTKAGVKLDHDDLRAYMPFEAEEADFLFGILKDTRRGTFVDTAVVRLETKLINLQRCTEDCYGRRNTCVPECESVPGIREKLEVVFRGEKFSSEDEGTLP